MDELDRSRFPFLGSLLMVGCPSRDQYGWPFQVLLKLRPGGHGTEDLVRDEHGRVLAWVLDERANVSTHVQVVPADVRDVAELWLRDQNSDGG